MRTDCYRDTIEWLATAASREEALHELDFIAKSSARMLGFVQSTMRSVIGDHFGIEVSEIELGKETEPTDIRQRLRVFLTTISFRNYQPGRLAVLAFCLENRVTPLRIVELIENGLDSIYSLFKPQFIHLLQSDTALVALHDLIALTQVAQGKLYQEIVK